MMLDTIDHQILELLKDNSRLSYTDIGRAINMSSPAVKTRIERLEGGAIEDYTVNINHEALNQSVHGFVLFQTKYCDRLLHYCETNNHITDLWRISGEYNYMAEVICSTPSELEQISKDTTAFAFSNILSALGNYNVKNK